MASSSSGGKAAHSHRLSQGSSTAVTYEGTLNHSVVCDTEAIQMCCQFNASGTSVATGLANGTISVLQPSTGTVLYKINSRELGKLPVTSVRFLENYTRDISKANILLATYASGYSCIWHVTSRQLLSKRQEDRQTLAAAVSPECHTFCTTGSDGSVYLYDANSHDKITTLEGSMSSTVMDGHMNRVFSLNYHPTNHRLLISAGWDDTVQFWDVRQPHSIRKICGPHVCGDGVAIHPTNFNIATGSWRLKDAIQLWDFNTGKLMKRLQPRINTKVYAVCWVEDECLLVGGSQQNKGVLIETSRDRILGGLVGITSGVYGLDFSSASKSVAIASSTKLYISKWKKGRVNSEDCLLLNVPT